ncbi:transposase, partial [Escherichia coli O174:H21 str. 03-3269]
MRSFASKNLASVSGDKDQVNMQQENTMPSTPDIGFFIHRPKYHFACETITGI